MTTLSGPPKQNENGCIVCGKDSTIECCKTKYCYVHVYGSKHAAHPTLFKFLSPVGSAEPKKEIEQIIQKCIHELEYDLMRIENTINTNNNNGSTTNVSVVSTLPVVSPQGLTIASPSQTILSSSSPSSSTPTATVKGPTFESIRNKAMQHAAAKRTAQQRKEEEALQNRHITMTHSTDLLTTATTTDQKEEGEVEEEENTYRTTPKRLRMFHLSSNRSLSSSSASSFRASPSINVPLLSSSSFVSSTSVQPPVMDEEGNHVSNHSLLPPWITRTQRNSVRKNILQLLFTTFRDNLRKDAEHKFATVSSFDSSRSEPLNTLLTTKMRQELLEAYAPKDEILQRICLDIEESLYNKYNDKRTLSVIPVTTMDDDGTANDNVNESSTLSVPRSTVTDDADELQYRDHARILIQNLRNSTNTVLRDRILTAELAPVQLVNLPYDDLVPKQVRQQRDDIRTLVMKQSTLDNEDSTIGWSTTNNIPCPACGSKRTIYIPMAGIRDIRKAEIWGTSGADDTTCRLKCHDCHYNWMSSNV